MKGVKEITLEGKKVKLRFTLGVLEDFQDFIGGVDVDAALGEMKNLREFLSIMTEYAGEKVPAEKFKMLDFDEMQDALEVITQAASRIEGNVGKPKGSK